MAEKIVRHILTYAEEAHHACADSYRKVMDYFTPRLSLGMTATPDRRDADVKGRDIYEVFGNMVLKLQYIDTKEI